MCGLLYSADLLLYYACFTLYDAPMSLYYACFTLYDASMSLYVTGSGIFGLMEVLGRNLDFNII